MLDIVIRPVGRMTNQMMQVLVAERYAQKFAGTTISGAALAEWRYPEVPVSRGHHSFPKIDIQRFDVAYLDDLIATGGTAAAATDLVERLGGIVIGYSFIIELGFLNGKERLTKDAPVHALITL
mgnify:CR=1 FL=1